MTLKEACDLKRGDMVSLIGAGGKTTTLYRLAHDLWQDGGKVLLTTTTKIFKPRKPHVHRLFLAQDLQFLTNELLKIREPVIVAVGYDFDEAGKLCGLPAEWCDVLLEQSRFDWILVEADGAAMKPFKVPAEHEPVVPNRSSITIWVMGIKVLGEPLMRASVHRAEKAAALLGVQPGTPVTEDLILRLVGHPDGCLKGIPNKSRKIALINQADTEAEVKKSRALGRLLIGCGPERVVITSYRGDGPVKEVMTAGG
ncbi:MAG: putative selenium-dependent hydroxylase accessory protein YqeC [Deltaproteobacteria bacterium]|nr:putative selenium-dependent hydroxylase accessory protein YqeC [Deltaproteobacteria bacterium]